MSRQIDDDSLARCHRPPLVSAPAWALLTLMGAQKFECRRRQTFELLNFEFNLVFPDAKIHLAEPAHT